MKTITILNNQLTNVKRITVGKRKTFITLNSFNQNEKALSILEKKSTHKKSFFTSKYFFLIITIDQKTYSIKAKI